MIDIANAVLEEYQRQGFELTLRQLYYQFVARNLFPENRKWVQENGRWVRGEDGTKNSDPNYGWLGQIVNDARLAGLIDWNHLVDRRRYLRTITHFDDAQDALVQLARWYHVDMWERQKVRPEVWVEKDALVGVVAKSCEPLDVPYFSCRGYTSQSEMWRAAQRLLHWHNAGYDTLIIHLGDHDPSGIDMSRDIFDRIEMFMGGTEFTRIALNMDQVERYKPPPNPAKVTDSRCSAYVEEYGDESWELDALEPAVINDLITEVVEARRNDDVYEEDCARRAGVKARLTKLGAGWGSNANLPPDELARRLCEKIHELDVRESLEEWLNEESEEE